MGPGHDIIVESKVCNCTGIMRADEIYQTVDRDAQGWRAFDEVSNRAKLIKALTLR